MKSAPAHTRSVRRLVRPTMAFLIASAVASSLPFLYLAPIMFLAEAMIHIPYVVLYVVALIIVPQVTRLPPKRLLSTSIVIGLIIGTVDFTSDIVNVSIWPWLSRSPFRPLLRLTETGAVTILISWLTLGAMSHNNEASQSEA